LLLLPILLLLLLFCLQGVIGVLLSGPLDLAALPRVPLRPTHSRHSSYQDMGELAAAAAAAAAGGGLGSSPAAATAAMSAAGWWISTWVALVWVWKGITGQQQQQQQSVCGSAEHASACKELVAA